MMVLRLLRTLMVHCSHLLPVAEKCSDGEFSAALSVVIKQQTDAFERQGYMWIVLGLLLNAPWVVLIFVLRSNIAYEG
jgi:hypothetical protein